MIVIYQLLHASNIVVYRSKEVQGSFPAVAFFFCLGWKEKVDQEVVSSAMGFHFLPSVILKGLNIVN